MKEIFSVFGFRVLKKGHWSRTLTILCKLDCVNVNCLFWFVFFVPWFTEISLTFFIEYIFTLAYESRAIHLIPDFLPNIYEHHHLKCKSILCYKQYRNIEVCWTLTFDSKVLSAIQKLICHLHTLSIHCAKYDSPSPNNVRKVCISCPTY